MQSKEACKFYDFIGYPDLKAARETVEFIKEQGYLGAVSAWQISFDLPFNYPEAFLRAMYKGLH
ncbi:hypothetical protein [Candidatus Coxiella mudrowiae]|uniref:hypothetical protein n=1 Tax=Candidatus Coxiella mudrowiae TaxID=2054173 RepID=UPI000C28B46C|nr:hypothetical protein [Candidatus Coxiella mudrowiae]